MTLLSEQLTAASSKYLTAPLNAQFNVFNALATQALDNASRITALNLSTSHDVIERSAQTARQLMGARDARDLAVLRSHAEEQVRSLFAYSRELFGIATSAQPFLIRTATQAKPAALPSPAALAEPAVQVAQVMVDASRDSYETAKAAAERTIDEVMSTPTPVPDPVAAAPAPVAEPPPPPAPIAKAPEPEPAAAPETAPTGETLSTLLQEQVLQDEPSGVQNVEPYDASLAPVDQDTPVARQKPIAKAAGKGAPKAAAGAHPLAAPIDSKDSAAVTRIDSAPSRRKK
jgi:phasin family protein